MSSLLTHVNLHIDKCSCGNHRPIQIEEIYLEEHAVRKIDGFLEKKGLHKLVMICDETTYEIAGKSLFEQLTQASCTIQVIQLIANSQGDIIADEISIVHILASLKSTDIDCLLAVGSGSIHDLVRFVASRMDKPFLSVPTAPSVDGFTSLGAPIILRGEKKTLIAVAPIAIFADLSIICGAPKQLIAAGFGDMIAKYTSLVDWKFSRYVADEMYCEAAANITREALDNCVNERERIASGEKRGIEILMLALIQSGLAMSVFGQSHPASGAEHHLSHYWEMKFIQDGRKQILHGAKVGVATIQISKLYHTIAQLDLSSGIMRKMNKESKYARRIADNWPEIKSWIETIPTPDQLIAWLRDIGAPHSLDELGIEPGLLEASMKDAYKVRDRYTIMRAYCES